MNLLSLVSPWLNKFCQITTKSAIGTFPQKFSHLNTLSLRCMWAKCGSFILWLWTQSFSEFYTMHPVIELLNLYKLKYDCSRLICWHAHTFTYINSVVHRVSRRTSVNQFHNQDRNRLSKYTSHTRSCSGNNITEEFTINSISLGSNPIYENNIAFKWLQ
jgi:hypothetical protein